MPVVQSFVIKISWAHLKNTINSNWREHQHKWETPSSLCLYPPQNPTLFFYWFPKPKFAVKSSLGSSLSTVMSKRTLKVRFSKGWILFAFSLRLRIVIAVGTSVCVSWISKMWYLPSLGSNVCISDDLIGWNCLFLSTSPPCTLKGHFRAKFRVKFGNTASSHRDQ